jgi:hypothetical protein
MALVRNIKEKVHLPIYDCIRVSAGKQLGKEHGSSSTLKFFSDVQGKTKLETNLQSAALLPHYNTFEARAMRVVISDLPPVFSEEEDNTADFEDRDVTTTNAAGNDVPVLVDANGVVPTTGGTAVTATISMTMDALRTSLRRARADANGELVLTPGDEPDGVTIDLDSTGLGANQEVDVDSVANAGGTITLAAGELESAFDQFPEAQRPPELQIHPDNGAGTLIGKVVYNTVTSLYVGEKLMIEMPTWFFPSGAGPYSEGKVTTHGEPSPTSTFRFAESVFIEKQQNFRVEIEVPDSDVWKELQRLYGPLFIWVVLDGYMTRDVQ